MTTETNSHEPEAPDYSPEFHMPPGFSPPWLIASGWRKPRDIVPGVCFERSVGMLVAPPFVGKTLLLMDLGLALAAYQPWLKWQPAKQTRSIIFALDSPDWESQEQCLCLMAGRGMDPQQQWPFSLVTRSGAELMRPCDDEGNPRLNQPALGPFNIMDQKWFEHLVHVAKASDTRFIGLDSFSKIHHLEENDRRQMEAVMSQIARLAEATNAHIMVLHHTPVLDRGESVYAGRGSSVIAASVDFKATIIRKSAKVCRFVVLKGRGSDEEGEFDIVKERVEKTVMERAVRWRWENPPTKGVKVRTVDVAWKFVASILQTSSEALSRKELLSLAHDAGLYEIVDRNLSRLRTSGLIQSPEHGRYTLTPKGRRCLQDPSETHSYK